MDLRIKKTYRALFDAFTELLEEYRFEDLTVAMLCDRAMIRRTTFYKHFRDKNDYFAFYIDELMSGLPQKQPDEAGAVSAEDVRALRHAILDDAMDLILAHERLMDNILASSMSGMLTNVICDPLALWWCVLVRLSRGRIIVASSTRILRLMPSLRPCALPLGRSVAGAFPIARSM